MTGQMSVLGRGGAVIAMSGGLVATMGMSSQAANRTTTGAEAAVPATAPIAVQPAVAFSGSLAAPSGAQTSSASLTAPVAATVSFESSDFTAVPNKVVISAVSGESSTGTSVSSSFGSARGSSVLAVAARYLGVPYRYGGTTPMAWDCSGATGYIYSQVGIDLPRTANQQMLSSTRISRSQAVPGDLVFFTSGGSAYHVGIYAGGNMMYDAGRTGTSFSKRAIWTSAVTFGRVA
ncbi:NlpC/P60 family protein [Kineosporia sp. NBRC 101731]|uniref:C40 family peptidase n=1 Tax=Kineosporia sp. NBRC 101731 TaxID=3032199 RepID=UPI002552E5C0|nr:NlpC/P60 family protein [Kineosporia sp. NBRC 101731]